MQISKPQLFISYEDSTTTQGRLH